MADVSVIILSVGQVSSLEGRVLIYLGQSKSSRSSGENPGQILQKKQGDKTEPRSDDGFS